MVAPREKFSTQAPPDLLHEMHEIAHKDGRYFQAVLEDAMREYVESRTRETPRPSVLAHFQASVERNRRLGELLAK